MTIHLQHRYNDLISLDNLLCAWEAFRKGKRGQPEVQVFELHFMDNLMRLHEDLRTHTYQHGLYEHFRVADPKPRDIHKASVRDRVLHHAIYRILYPFLDRTFIADTYSCRDRKGLHKAMNKFRAIAHRISHNDTRTCWILKCDIKKFFAHVDHTLLLARLKTYIPQNDIMILLQEIVGSFRALPDRAVGLPLGNLTSQLFANVYLHVLDQWVKHHLKVADYVRYGDDMVFLSHDRMWLQSLVQRIQIFLVQNLKLSLHPDKLLLKTFASGVDFLGWVQFPDHRVLRASTAKRMLRRVQEHPTSETVQSYLGLLKHGNTHKVQEQVKALEWLWGNGE